MSFLDHRCVWRRNAVAALMLPLLLRQLPRAGVDARRVAVMREVPVAPDAPERLRVTKTRASRKMQSGAKSPRGNRPSRGGVTPLERALPITAIRTAIAFRIPALLDPINIVMVYLLRITLTGLRCDPLALSAIGNVTAYGYFFVPSALRLVRRPPTRSRYPAHAPSRWRCEISRSHCC